MTTAPRRGPSHRRGWLRATLIVLVAVGMFAGGLTIFWMIGSELGFWVFAAGVAIALLPVPLLVAWFVWLDRFDPAPWKYLVFAFGWGAFVSTALSLGVNTFGAWLFHREELPGWAVAVFVAPVIEEITKALALLLLFWFRRREIVGVADALVYAGLSATGFAMTENVLYLGQVYVSGERLGGAVAGVGGVIGLVIFRLGLTGFIHPLFTAMTAIGVGLAARSGRKPLRWLFPTIGLALAMSLHGSWNLMATFLQRSRDFDLLGYAYLLGALPLLFGFVVFALWARAEPGRVARRVLPDYARAGWLSPPEVGSLVTLRRRLWARRWAEAVAGPDGSRAMRGYQAAGAKLAMLRDNQLRGVSDPGHDDEEQRLLGELVACRQVFTGRDRWTPPAWWDGQRYLVTFPDGVDRLVEGQRPMVMPVPMARPQFGHLPVGSHGALPPGHGPPHPHWHGPPQHPGHAPPPPGYGAAPPGYGPPPASGPSAQR